LSRYQLALGYKGKPGEEVVIKIGESLYDTLYNIITSFPDIGKFEIIKTEFGEKAVLIIASMSISIKDVDLQNEHTEIVQRKNRLFVQLNERIKEIFPLAETLVGPIDSTMPLGLVFKNPIIKEKSEDMRMKPI
jgi:hypothetical protein